MNRFDRIRSTRSIRRVLAGLASLGCAVLAFAATGTAAFASEVPPGGATGTVPPPTGVSAVAAGGMPGWQITLIALGAALLAAAVAVLLDRARAARREPAVASA